MGWENPEISILLVDDREITRLNQKYFQRNYPTNVISFPMSGGDPQALNPHILGDVVISVETADRQAREAGEKTEEEVQFLLIHGILHLLGFDHEGSIRERRRMEAKERELFLLIADGS